MEKYKIKGSRVVTLTLGGGGQLTLQPGIYELPSTDEAVKRLVDRGVMALVEAPAAEQPAEAPAAEQPAAEAPAAEQPAEAPAAEQPAAEAPAAEQPAEAPAAEQPAEAPRRRAAGSRQALPSVPVPPQNQGPAKEDEDSWEEEGGAE